MKKYAATLLTALALRAMADVNVSIDIHAKADFEAPLAGDGRWVVAGRFGRCWHPNGIQADWRPYCNGEWVWTDCGWYWSSEEPWAWACYHYGSWVEDPVAGWVWIPDIEWSPAWVTWRTGGGYIGWAPCGPAGVVVAPALFAFVEIGHFGEPISRARLTFNDSGIIGKTKEIHQVRHESHDIGGGHSQRVAINEGPNVADVEKATGKKFAASPIAETARRNPPPRSMTPANVPRTGQPSTEVKPRVPERPETPVPSPTPVKPVTPATPERPETRDKPVTPSKPETPNKPETPLKPETRPETRPDSPPADKDKKGGGDTSAILDGRMWT